MRLGWFSFVPVVEKQVFNPVEECRIVSVEAYIVHSSSDEAKAHSAFFFSENDKCWKVFGGVYNYNKVPWWARKALEAERPKLEAAYKETQPGIYDMRDWNAIRSWAKELA